LGHKVRTPQRLIERAPMQETVRFRSRIAYAHLALAVVVSVLVALVGGPAAGGVLAALGLVWVLLTYRSRIEVTSDGFKVNSLFRTRHLGWSQTDAFIVISYAGTDLPEYYRSLTPGNLSDAEVGARFQRFSLVAVVIDRGERIKVRGTASSALDAVFPAQAAAELNRILKQHNPAATAS
jgi:hypothetical protein